MLIFRTSIIGTIILLSDGVVMGFTGLPGTNYGRVLGVSFVVSHLQPYHLTHDLFLLCKENRYENTHEPTVNKSLSWQPKLILMVTLILHPSSPLTPPPPPTPPFFHSFPFWREKGRGGGGGCGREVGEVLGKRLVANQIGAISLHPCLTALLGLKASGLTDWVTDLLDHRLTITPLILTLLLHTPPL